MLKAFVVQNPKLAYALGRAMFSVGGFLILLAVMAWTAKGIINTARGKVPQPPIERLSELAQTPMFWLIPEGFFGVLFAVAIAGAGCYMAITAGKMLKAYGMSGRRKRR